jgi:O-antigen/teichoic acid export membrane protein
LSNIRVRRSGLFFFLTRLGSILTGLIFVVIAASHLSAAEYGLWALIGKTISYVVLASAILTFWTTRYRARGVSLGKTIVIGSAMISALLTIVYLAISFPISGTVGQVTTLSNFYYFLLSAPQIALYTFAGALEALLLGVSPEKNSISFILFEIAKITIAFVLIAVLRLSLEGAVLSIIFAQIVQLSVTLFLTRNEYVDRFSFDLIRKMVKTGWIGILNNLHGLVIGFDFLIIAAFTRSAVVLAYFSIAQVASSASEYSSYLAGGLYPSVLAGSDPKVATKNVFELQLIFLCPLVLGTILLRTQILNLINYNYIAPVSGILVILTIGGIFDSLQSLFESTISGTDKTDAKENVRMSDYLQSRLFWISRINLFMASAYLGALVVLGAVLGSQISSTFFGMSGLVFVGMIWAVANGVMSAVALTLKIRLTRRIAPFSIDFELIRALVVGSLLFSIATYLFASYYKPPQAHEVMQALNLLGIGVAVVTIYGGVIYALSRTARALVRAILQNLIALVR